MISLILPYWDRQGAAIKALAQLKETYGDLDFEIVLVDDGNAVPFVVPDIGLNIKVVTLPRKDIPKCPTTAWNAGVEAASGEIIVLSCIEILHTKPVLKELADAVMNIGPLGYVLAAAWCPDSGDWHCHSTVKTPRNPTGTGIAFCGAMHKDLYLKAGGFDDAYREGAGYEDNDFINRMLVAGARFVIRDDLVVIHPKEGASIQWGEERFLINERLYYQKWPKELRLNSITFCCVNAGDYLGRGREYVKNLRGMLGNCLPSGLAFKFVCFTDDPFECEGVEFRLLPSDSAVGWNQKIALFKQGVFEDGERVVYLDLDTLLIGRIDKVLDYQGEFAVLRDFWRPTGLGPAVILWRGGFGGWIYEKYEKSGFPQLERGDQEWLELVFAEEAYQPNILQDLYPTIFCSFKNDCRPHPPQNTRIVCFHGLPRPHDVPGWVQECWSGRATGAALEMLCNVEMAKIAANIRHNSARDIVHLDQLPAKESSVLLIGGGPSMKNCIEEIREKAKNSIIIAMNGSADYLAENGIKPDIQIGIDARAENLRFFKKRSAAQYYLASQCDPAIFDFIGDAILFHIALVDWDQYLPDTKPAMAIGGGHSVGMYAMSLAYVLGFRKMHLYGYDSSYREDEHHAYSQQSNDDDPVIEAYVNDRTYKTTNWMVVQVNEFKDLSRELAQMGCTITTHGDGLLPYVAWQTAMLANAA